MKVIIPFLLFLMALPPGFGQGTVTVSGFIHTPCGHPLPGVELLGTQTDSTGYYSVEVGEGTVFSITPFLPDWPYPDLDTNDLQLLHNILTSQAGFSSPYQALAADLNYDEEISTFDYVLLHKHVYGVQPLGAFPLWQFFPTGFAFQDVNDPWQSLGGLSTTYTAFQDTVIDFIGVARADMDCSTVLWAGPTGTLRGRAVVDQDADCLAGNDEPGYAGWTIQIVRDAGGVFYATTGTGGFFETELPPGGYRVSVLAPSTLWLPCVDSIPVDIDENGISTLEFPFQSAADCPYLEVDISPASLRRCTTNTYQVRYCNSGTVPAEEAYVKVTFDNYLDVVGSSLPWSSASGTTYTFPLGNIPVGSCGSFSIQTYLNCDALFGQTHCVEAHIFPDSLCTPVPGPLLHLEGNCTGDSVQFHIENVGGDMPEVRHFIVIEDDLVMFNGQFQLGSGETFELSRAANGSTQRLQLEPAPGSPSGLAVEACGATGPEGPSLGYVTQYPTGSGNPFIDINCRENTGPYDPNDKQAFPKGQGNSRWLHPTSSLEYLIRFQNTGTDTAFLVVIRDTLPVELDPATLRPGASSHPYTCTLRANGVAEFRFDNIMLPDSAANLEGSQGFVQFYIEQKTGNPNWAIIENSAAIYFDFNEPIITNLAWHIIDDFFMLPEHARLGGAIQTENGRSLGANTLVFLIRNQDTIAVDTVNAGGGYFFDMLLPGQAYTVAPYRNDDPYNGVNLFDMVLLSKHMLGIQPLDSPYKLLAADINYSGAISVLDMIALRRLILSDDTEPFPENKPSWRFVQAYYLFPDPANPWLAPFPVTVTFDELIYDSGADFTGIKVGDLNGDARPNLLGVEGRGRLPVCLESKTEEGGAVCHLAAARPGEWVACQAGLQLPPGVALQGVRAGTATGELAYSLSESGYLRLCWFHTEAVSFEEGAPLFTIEFSKGFTPKELLPGFSLAFTDEGQPYELVLENQKGEQGGIQIFPNPAGGAFTISGHTEAAEVYIRIYGLSGRAVYRASAPGGGNWAHVLPENALPAGVYTVEARAGGQRWIERLVAGR